MLTLLAETALGATVSVIRAARRTTALILDGKLDDACWKAARPITHFRRQGSQTQAEPTTTGYIVFDNDNLYTRISQIDSRS